MIIFNIFIILICCFCFFLFFFGSCYYHNSIKKNFKNKIETKKNLNFSTIITSNEGINSLGILVDLNTIKLLYRYVGSSLPVSDFHNACDNKGPTLLIIQASTGAIGLAYISVSWDSISGYKTAPLGSCWLCKLQINDKSVPNITLYKNNINIQYSIFCDASAGPIIGYGEVAINVPIKQSLYSTEIIPYDCGVYLVPNGLFNHDNNFQSFTLKAIEVFSVTANNNI
jgi:hypothetical protein